MTRPRLLLCTLALTSCALVGPPDDGRLFKCETDGSCRPGFTCLDGLCHPTDAGAAGGTGGAAGGAGGGAGGPGGGGGAGGGARPDAGPCGMTCPTNAICGGGGATPGVCSPPRVCKNGFCWENPIPQGHTLYDALAFGPGDVWLVGDYGTILHSEAGGWVGYPSGTTRVLRGIHGRAPNDLYAVGASCTVTHFDGTRWTVQTTGTCPEELRAVWALADGTVLAVGSGMRALHRYGAGAWTTVSSLPSASTTYFQILGAGDEIIAVTYDMGAYRWNAPLTQFLQLIGPAWPIDRLRSQAVERLGNATYVCGSFGAVMRRDDDAGWSVYRDGGMFPDEACTALCGTGPLDVWLTSDGDSNTPLLRHYPINALDRPGQRSNTCVAQREGLMTIAGDYGFNAEATDAGLASSARTKDAPVQNFQSVFSAGDPAWLAAPRNLGAVARRGTMGWTDPTVIPGAQQSYGVWASGPNDIWVTSIESGGGSVWRFNGSIWVPIAGNAPVYGVWGLSPDEVYFGGEGRILVSRNRGGITPVLNLDAGEATPVRGLWAGGNQPLTAVSFGGTIFTRTQPDGGWTSQQLAGRQLQAIHGAVLPDGGADVWIAGGLGALFHREGAAWVYVDAGQGETELSAVFAEADRTWVAGGQGTVLLRTSTGWARVETPAGAHLRGIWAQPDGGGVWLVGDFGQIVSKIPAR